MIATRLFALLLTLAASSLAEDAAAQLFRAYLSPTGNDANPCTLPSPCRLLPAALAAVGDGGEIWMLDSANYNSASVTIGKSVTLLAVPGAVGSLVSTGGQPAIVLAVAGTKVVLRNIVLVPVLNAVSSQGAVVPAGTTLVVEGGVVANFSAGGIVVGGGKAQVSGASFRNNLPSAMAVSDGGHGVVKGATFFGNGTGIVVSGNSTTTTVAVDDSTFADNAVGLSVAAIGVDGRASAYLVRSLIEGSTNTALGLSANDLNGVALIYLNGTAIVRNPGPAWVASSLGVSTVVNVRSSGNNQIADNGASNPAVLVSSSLQ